MWRRWLWKRRNHAITTAGAALHALTRGLISALALASGPFGAFAQAQTPANPEPTAVQPGDYAEEPFHARVGFAVSHMEFTD